VNARVSSYIGRHSERYSSGMTIPLLRPQPVRADVLECDWSALEPAAKRERLLDAAGELFAREGLDASMPAVAAAAGAGVASVYRQFPSKRELIAALVCVRLDRIAAAAREATASYGDRWTALTEMLHSLVDRQRVDDLLGEARMLVAEHSDVIAATERASAALEELLDAARAEGRLRADATTLDLRLVFAATRAAREVAPMAWTRMLELLIDSLDTAAHQ
jgi:AcrR family transcriptional regulator